MGGTRKNPSGEVVLKTGVLWELCQAQAKQRERMKGKPFNSGVGISISQSSVSVFQSVIVF